MTGAILVRGAMVLLAVQLASSVANAVERHAFVVGLNTYENIAPLETARSDAEAVANALSAHGFRTVTLLDPDRRTFSLSLSEFVGSVQTGDDVVFFFAGHGVAVAGTNYLLAADFPQLRPGQDGVLRDEGFSATEVMDRIKQAGARTTVAILDACRNNPLATVAGRSIGGTRGLARVEPSQGSFVLFSADTGQEALDRLPTDSTETNSVFTRFLLPYLTKGTLTFPEIARAVRRDVFAAARTADHDQLPAYYDALLEDFRLAATSSETQTQAPAVIEPPIVPHTRETLALLVGINDYQHLPKLKGAVADALSLDAALRSRGSKTMLLTDAAATGRAVRAALSSVAERVGAGDTFVFAFSGHGWRFEDSGAVWRLFFVENVAEGSSDQMTTVELAEIANRIAATGANVVLVVDAISALAPVASVLQPRVTALFAQGDGKSVPEVYIEGIPHGPLSWSVARAFAGQADSNGDGALSQNELSDFVTKSVREITSGKQTPGIKQGGPVSTVLLPQ